MRKNDRIPVAIVKSGDRKRQFVIFKKADRRGIK